MQNIQSRLADLPQWQKIGMAALMAFLVVFSMFAPSRSYAATTYPTLPSNSSNGYFIYLASSGVTYYVGLDSTSGFFYHAGTDDGVYVQGSSSTWYSLSSDGTTWTKGYSNSSGSKMSIGVTATSVTQSTVDIYTDSTKSGVFFSAPKPPAPPAKLAQVTDLPQAILTPLTTGGILGMGLTILAIMLGVSLVPRLIHLFNR